MPIYLQLRYLSVLGVFFVVIHWNVFLRQVVFKNSKPEELLPLYFISSVGTFIFSLNLEGALWYLRLGNQVNAIQQILLSQGFSLSLFFQLFTGVLAAQLVKRKAKKSALLFGVFFLITDVIDIGRIISIESRIASYCGIAPTFSYSFYKITAVITANYIVDCIIEIIAGNSIGMSLYHLLERSLFQIRKLSKCIILFSLIILVTSTFIVARTQNIATDKLKPLDGGTEKQLRSILLELEEIQKISFPTEPLRPIDMGGTVAAVSKNVLASRLNDGTIRLWQLANRHHITSIQLEHPEGNLILSRDERFLIFPTTDNITVWNLETGTPYKTLNFMEHQELQFVEIPTGINFIPLASISPNSHLLAFTVSNPFIVGGENYSSVIFWNLLTNDITKVFETENCYDLEFSPTGEHLVASCGVHLYIWDINKQILKVFTDYTSHNTALSFSPNGEYLAVGCLTECIATIWNTKDWTLDHSLQYNECYVRHDGTSAIVFSNDSNLIFTGTYEGGIDVWWIYELDNPRKTIITHHLRTLFSHKNAVVNLSMSSDSKLLVSGSVDGTIRLWGIK
ncbi:MAG: hypothetical protein HY869_03530 [Chloroflexi bacterium]|nr:hypothetical protein [Chloroflexota bacterium]